MQFHDFKVFGTSLEINNAGEVAFLGELAGTGVTSANDSGLWLAGSDAVELVLREGMQAPGAPAGSNFKHLYGYPAQIALNNVGNLAIRASISGIGEEDTGVWLQASDNLTLIARAGQHPPGTDARYAKFSGFYPVSLNDHGQIALHAYVSDTTYGVVDIRYGIWATDRNGALQLIAIEDSYLEVAPGDQRWVTSVYYGSMNNRGQISFLAKFIDGSQGIFVSDLVAIPEPHTGIVARWLTFSFLPFARSLQTEKKRARII